uniref:Uncharacterized protein n=1 Tax=Arundo donax TaxID=35708 RepID=A0A0A9ALJ4_ARUDO
MLCVWIREIWASASRSETEICEHLVADAIVSYHDDLGCASRCVMEKEFQGSVLWVALASVCFAVSS